MAETETQDIVVDFGKICRLCLTEEGVLISLYSEDSEFENSIKSIPEKILELMAIRVTIDDGFPSWICHNCLSQIDKCCEFFDMCRTSQSTLNESYIKALAEAKVAISNLKGLINEKSSSNFHNLLKTEKHDDIVFLIQADDSSSLEGITEEYESNSGEIKKGKINQDDMVKKKYFCSDCTKIYLNVNEYLIHRISVHHDDLVTETTQLDELENKITELWTCDICNCKLHSKSAVSSHLRSQHQINDEKESSAGKLIFCKYCGLSFSQKQVLKHFQMVHRLIKCIELEQPDGDSLDCKICYRPFTRQSSLRNHIEKFHDGLEVVAESENCVIVWKCNECNSLFSEEVFVMQHYGDKHLKYLQEADSLKVLISKHLICHCGVINLNSVDSFIHDTFCHKGEDGKEGSLECLACYEIFTQVNDLRKHLVSFHSFVVSNCDNKCVFCLKEFVSNETLRAHLHCEHGVRLYNIPKKEKLVQGNKYEENLKGLLQEDDCGSNEKVPEKNGTTEPVSSRSAFDSHGDPYDNEGDPQSNSINCKSNHSCQLCGKKYKTSVNLRRHIMEYHNSMLPIKCPLCPKVFPRKLNLHNHYKRRHLKQTKKFVCSYCGVSLKGKVALRSHEDRLHRNIRNYKCSECPEAFTTRSILHKHAQRHLAVRPMFQCQHCEKRFSTMSGIERHVKTHEGVKDFVCELETCGKSFYTKSELKRHMKFHTRDFKHVCPVCDHRFMTPGELKKHSTKHTGERPFKCHLCSCAYSRRDDKVKHLKRVHNLKVKRVYGKPLRKYSDENSENIDTIVVDEEASVEVTSSSAVICKI